MKYRFIMDFDVGNPLTEEDMLEIVARLEAHLWNLDQSDVIILSGLEIIDSSLNPRWKE